MIVENTDLHLELESLRESGIQYLGIINKQGRLISNIFQNDISLPEKKREILCMQQRLQCSMESDFDEDFGDVVFTVTKRENSIIISIPIFSYLVFAIIDKNADHNVLAKKIATIMKSSWLWLSSQPGFLEKPQKILEKDKNVIAEGQQGK